MLTIDRAGFIELLDRLGAEDDAVALAAARELHRHMSEADITWDDLLLPESERETEAPGPDVDPEPWPDEAVADGNEDPAAKVMEDGLDAEEQAEDGLHAEAKAEEALDVEEKLDGDRDEDALEAEDEAETDDELEAEDEPETEDEPEAIVAAEMPSPATLAEDARIIERLLAKKTLSKNMREELADLKRAIAEGEFDAMDSRYVRALGNRLGP